MEKLTYYVKKNEESEAVAFLEYIIGQNITEEEVYARQLCDYHVVGGKEYALYSNEWENNREDGIVLLEKGEPSVFSEEHTYDGKGLYIEVREYQEERNMPLLLMLPCQNRIELIRYLLKHALHIPEYGYYEVTSREVDEDRSVFVLYVTFIHE